MPLSSSATMWFTCSSFWMKRGVTGGTLRRRLLLPRPSFFGEQSAPRLRGLHPWACSTGTQPSAATLALLLRGGMHSPEGRESRPPLRPKIFISSPTLDGTRPAIQARRTKLQITPRGNPSAAARGCWVLVAQLCQKTQAGQCTPTFESPLAARPLSDPPRAHPSVKGSTETGFPSPGTNGGAAESASPPFGRCGTSERCNPIRCSSDWDTAYNAPTELGK